MTCESALQDISLFLYGELGFEEEERLQEHLDGCAGCRRALESERRLHTVFDAAEIPLPPTLLTDCRRTLRSETIPNAQARPDWVSRIWNVFTVRRAWNPVAATALLTLGFLGGKFLDTKQPGGMDGVNSASMGPVASRVRYVEPSGSGQVRIVLEEVREKRLSGAVQDARIRQLLLDAARESEDPGLRVESMEILGEHSQSAEIRGALLASLQQDPNPGVRLKALAGLKSFAQDPETRKVLSRVLLADDNPGVRMQAIDMLIQRPEPAMAGVLQEALEKEHNNYVRQRCVRALRDMNASVETF